MTTKVCCVCKVPKPLDQFYRQLDQIDGRGRKCKDCKREYNFKREQDLRDRKSQFIF